MSDSTSVYGPEDAVPAGPHETHEELTIRTRTGEIPPSKLPDQTGVTCGICWSVFDEIPGGMCTQCNADHRDGDWLPMPFLIANRYECFRTLGRGAMGAVFLARDAKRKGKRKGTPLALKLVQNVGGKKYREMLREMFDHEAGVATLLGKTELFVKVLAHESSGSPYLVMEYVPWPTLRGLFKAEKPPLATDTVVRLGLAILEAVEIMHFYRIVHRDLKPPNMFAMRHGQEGKRFKVKIADLGVWTEDHDAQEDAKSDGMFVGSLSYASPEQMRCEPVGARSDLYSVACILWEAATGAVPYRATGSTLPARLANRKLRVQEPPKKPDEMSPMLYLVLKRALAHEPSDRFASARPMADALRVAGGLAERSPSEDWDALSGTGEERQEGDRAGKDGRAGQVDTALRGRLESTYDVHRMLGAGGTTRVYEAWQRSLDRRVVLKIINHNAPEGFDEDHWFAMFRVEAQAASRLDHPNHVNIIDFGYDAEDLPYMALEFVVAESLEDRLRERGPMSEIGALTILTPVAGTLVEAHSLGIIHRNLKPKSVWLKPIKGAGEVVKVANYGMTLDDLELLPKDYIFGTPRYMAPELIRGKPPSKAADMYALGMLLYLSVSSTAPYEYRNTRELLRAKLIGRARPLPEMAHPGNEPISRGFRAVCDALLLADPDHRPHHAEEVYQWLDALRVGVESKVPIGRLEAVIGASRASGS